MARKSTGGKAPRHSVILPVTAADFTALLSALINSKGNTTKCSKLSENIGFLCSVVASETSERGIGLVSCPDDAALTLLAETLNKDIREDEVAADIVKPLAELLRLPFCWNSTAVASSDRGRAFLQQLVTFVAEDVPVLLLDIDEELVALNDLIAVADEADDDYQSLLDREDKTDTVKEGFLDIVRLLAVLLRKAEQQPETLTYLRRELLLPKYKVWKRMVDPSQPGYIKDLAAAIAETLGEWLNAGVEAERVSMVVELAKHCRGVSRSAPVYSWK